MSDSFGDAGDRIARMQTSARAETMPPPGRRGQDGNDRKIMRIVVAVLAVIALAGIIWVLTADVSPTENPNRLDTESPLPS